MQIEKQRCPICKGSGAITRILDETEEQKKRRKEIASILREDGFTLREIAALMGYKAHSQVYKLLEDVHS